jgi:serine-type D-Ala-D-Ala carboxypeptidase (penicillin-binding protein 5/6)
MDASVAGTIICVTFFHLQRYYCNSRTGYRLNEKRKAESSMQQRTILAIAFVMMLVLTVVAVIIVSSALPNLQYLVRLVVPDASPTQEATEVPTPTPTPSPTPVPFITGTAAYLIDADTGRVLYSLHSTQQLPIASTTKIMSAIVTIENANLDQGVIVQQSDLDQVPPDASTAGLVAGDYFRLRTLLYGLMLPSGTDASIVIARAVAGTTANFVR